MKTATVVTWATNHNPVGRAYVLASLLTGHYKVDIQGFCFPRYGREIWAPLLGAELSITPHLASDFPQFREEVEAVARSIRSDVVIVSKPRLPGLLLAVLANRYNGCTVILDIDDMETAFTSNIDDADINRPYGQFWTEACSEIVSTLPDITVSNHRLQAVYGGQVIPHARSSQLYNPNRYGREEVRRSLGVSPRQQFVMFGGTSRRHKGILEVARAMESLNNYPLVLGVLNTSDMPDLSSELGSSRVDVRLIDPPALTDMPRILRAADVAVAIQDPLSPVSAFQMPAKVSDAMAMRVPCIVTRVPPLEPLIDMGFLNVAPFDELAQGIASVLDNYPAAMARAEAARRYFEAHQSVEAVAPGYVSIVDKAVAQRSPIPEVVNDLVSRALRSKSSPTPTGVRQVPRGNDVRKRTLPHDVVMFWKQNDTGVYGRRHDMVARELALAPSMRRVVQFDAPIGVAALRGKAQEDPLREGSLIHRQTLDRALGRANAANMRAYTYIYDDTGVDDIAPARDLFFDYVELALAREHVDPRTAMFLMYPFGEYMPALVDRFQPAVVVTELVDDNRTWHSARSSRYGVIEENYRALLARSDVVIANCDELVQRFAGMHPDIRVVPNGVDTRMAPDPGEVPEELANIVGPVIGYVGNLSSRIDVSVLEYLADAEPSWTLVLVGSAHGASRVLQLREYPNVLIIGPRTYQDSVRFMKSFDVAMIPHINNMMTQSMNPLKAYVYAAIGVPVVSTPIANLPDIPGGIHIASGPVEFHMSVCEALAGTRPEMSTVTPDLAVLSWQSRVGAMLEAVTVTLAGSQL